MSRKGSALAGTALGLLMAASPFAAHAFVIPVPLPGKDAKEVRGNLSVPFTLVQDEEELTEEERRQQQQQQENQQQEEQEQEQGRDAEAVEEPGAEQPAAEPEPEPAPQAEEEPPAEPEPETPAPEEPEAPADAGEDEPAQGEEPAPEQSEEVPPAEAEQPAEDEEAPADAEEPVEDNQPAEGEVPAEDQQPAEGEEALPEGAQDPAEERPAEVEEPADAGQPPEDEEVPADEQEPAAEEQPAEGEEPAEPDQPAEGEDAPAEDEQEPADDEQPAEPGQPAEGEEPVEGEQPAEAEEAPADEETTEEGRPEDAAPILDSQKVPGGAEPQGEAPEGEEGQVPAEGEEAQQPAEDEQAEEQPAEAAPPPESDAAAQRGLFEPEEIEVEIEQVIEEQGERIELGESREERREQRRELRQRREDVEVIQEFEDNRTIIQINNQIFIDSPDYDRIIFDDDEVYYERLPRDRYREVVTRPDGVRVVTIYNRYGDVVRRVRVAPDGRRYVLAYVPDRDLDRAIRFQDPSLGLPPLRLTIPREEYILEAEADYNPDRYYTFLDQPPVEPVQRIYSLEEVKYSARVRDIVRRVDLDTIEFEFGSATIEESEIDELEAIADAILRFLDENPGETFLIEGHTDAVGSETANLALSDRRAEAVARALTNVFGVPPENLVTQGYGEQYLKINTQERERENRRVAIRRITPLVAPVASAQ